MSFGNNNYNSNGGRQQRVTTNRFGEPEVLVACTQKIDKKTGSLVASYKGYIEIGGQLYKLEVSNANKPSNDGRDRKWVKVTKKQRRTTNNFTRF